MFRYVCTPQQLYSEELGNYSSFGLSAQKQVQGEWVQCGFVPDVSVRQLLYQLLAEQLAQLCTDGQLDPVHLMDVVEDHI